MRGYPKNKGPQNFKGKVFSSQSELAKSYNIRPTLFMRRVNQMGWSISEALELTKRKRIAHNAKKLMTKNGIFNSIREASKATGIEEGTINRRLKLGWTPNQALCFEKKIKKQPLRGTKIICKGKTFPSIFDFADHFNQNRIRTYKRLRSGWTPEQSVGLESPPPRYRNQDGSARDHLWTKKTILKSGQIVPEPTTGIYNLYVLRNLQNGKEYVGITGGNLNQRLRTHWRSVKVGRQSKLYNAMRKAKKEGRKKDFIIELVRSDAKNFQEWQEQEYKEIIKRDTIKKGYNTAEGGAIGTPKPIEVNGKRFSSQLSAANYYGVDFKLFSLRLNRLKWTPEQAAGLDPDKKYGREITVEGKYFKSLNQASLYYGIGVSTVRMRLKNRYKNNWSIKQIFGINEPPKDRAGIRKKIISKKGNYSSINKAALAHGLKRQTVARRLKSGWSIDQALNIDEPPNTTVTRGVTIELEGKKYKSITSAAKAYGLNDKYVRKRIRKDNWTIEEAFELKTRNN